MFVCWDILLIIPFNTLGVSSIVNISEQCFIKIQSALFTISAKGHTRQPSRRVTEEVNWRKGGAREW